MAQPAGDSNTNILKVGLQKRKYEIFMRNILNLSCLFVVLDYAGERERLKGIQIRVTRNTAI